MPSPTTGLPIFRASATSERAELAADGDHGVGGARHDRVACLAEAGRDPDRGARGVRPVVAGRTPTEVPPAASAAAGGGVHHAAEVAADEDGAGLREQASDLLGGGRLVVGRLPRPITRCTALAHGGSIPQSCPGRRVGPSPHVPRIAARSEAAACLSSGSLPFPHFGLWTHDGQP